MTETVQDVETMLQSWFLIATGVTVSTEENYMDCGYFDPEDLSRLFNFISDRFGVKLRKAPPIPDNYLSITGLVDAICHDPSYNPNH